jgi:UDP-N-acetylglucosamine 2-epimerase
LDNGKLASAVERRAHEILKSVFILEAFLLVYRKCRRCNKRKEEMDFNKSNGINIQNPMDYKCFSHLMKQFYMVITDSEGIQEEAPAIIPVLVARESTERLEGVKAGILKLAGTNSQEIIKAARTLLEDAQEYRRMGPLLGRLLIF